MKSLLAAGVVLAGLTLLAADKPGTPKEKVLPLFVEEFVTIAPGKGDFPASFEMGTSGADAPDAEKPAHKVSFKQPFRIAKYEVTQELYELIMGKNPSRWKGPRNSVELISWGEANEFCQKATDELRKQKLIGADEVVRLPSEAEWEYVCRSGTKSRYSFGDKLEDLGDYGWFNGNAKGNDPPVGKKKPNPWGLYDLHGYIWEWCADAWHLNYENAPSDGSAWDAKDAKERVMRGGSWADPADAARSAYRGHAAPDKRSDAIGFRCVLGKKAAD